MYPKPKYNRIIEPFAGAAGYSLRHYDKEIILYDTYEPVISLWNYLIKVKPQEILSLPADSFTKENPISNCSIPEEAKALIGFWVTESQTYSSNYALSKSRGGNWTERKRSLIANQVEAIRHWKAEVKSYQELDNADATWFVDPPYQQAGKRYKNNSIDYDFLAKWCKKRQGQTIVCEQEGATWLNFNVLSRVYNGSNKHYKEVAIDWDGDSVHGH